MEEQGVDGGILLNWLLKKEKGILQTGCMRLRMRTSGE
jgi:hypothetical protein